VRGRRGKSWIGWKLEGGRYFGGVWFAGDKIGKGKRERER
jgi:hypothetical protein